MDADHGPQHRSRAKAVPLASLPLAQRRLVSALLEAAKATAIRYTAAADTDTAARGVGELHHRQKRLP